MTVTSLKSALTDKYVRKDSSGQASSTRDTEMRSMAVQQGGLQQAEQQARSAKLAEQLQPRNSQRHN